MRILDFVDGFESNTQPTITGVAASSISVTPAGSIASANVQTALEELDSEKVAKVATSTDHAIPRFDGTSGVQQNSGVTIDDSNNVIIPGNLTVQGTTTTIDAENLEVEDHNITINKNGNDASAEGAGLTIERTSTDGSIVFDSTKTSKFKIGLAGSEVEVADISSAQTLTNKTIDDSNNTLTVRSSSVDSESATNGYVLTADGSGGTSWLAQASSPALPTIQKFTSGSGTYTTPANVRYLRVRMVGGGSGSSGSGTAGAGNGGAGGNTTFGSSLLVANGGASAVYGANNGPAGGSASLGTGPIGFAIQGGYGQAAMNGTVAGNQINATGPAGGSSFFGGAGSGGKGAVAGTSPVANSGSGAGAPGCNSVAANVTGTSGAAGGYVDAIIHSPSASYAYAVGAAGTAGTIGTNGVAGTAGAAGIIIVEEYY